jgi:hypothetical protein
VAFRERGRQFWFNTPPDLRYVVTHENFNCFKFRFFFRRRQYHPPIQAPRRLRKPRDENLNKIVVVRAKIIYKEGILRRMSIYGRDLIKFTEHGIPRNRRHVTQPKPTYNSHHRLLSRRQAPKCQYIYTEHRPAHKFTTQRGISFHTFMSL